ncbi:hypothetical protein HNV12_01590 [Methanococcoides sp. SA1]|nr:hypothetical protein [Methanococcoides sp. SA1]
MEFFNNLGWLGKSMASMLCLIPYMLFFMTFIKGGLKPEAIIFAWLLGCVIGILAASFGIGPIETKMFTIKDLFPTTPFLIMLAIGIILGASQSLLMTYAMPIAPNPSYVSGILGLASVITISISPAIHKILPTLVEKATFNWRHLVAFILIAIAISLIKN